MWLLLDYLLQNVQLTFAFEVGWSSGIFPTVPIRQVLFTKFIELLIDKMVKET